MRGAFHSAGSRRLAALAAALAALAAGPLGRADPGLRGQALSLRAEEAVVLLQVYGLDSRLAAVRSELARIRARIVKLERDQAAARAQLRVARETLAISERRLGRTLVAMYESGSNDPFTVIFGATSLTELVGGLDNLTRIASSHAVVAADASNARRQIAAASRSLRLRTAESRRLEEASESKTGELAGARAERATYLASVRARSTALADRLAAVEARARAAQARATIVATEASAAGSVAGFGARPVRPTPPVETAEPLPEEAAPIQAPPSGARVLSVSVTAYSIKGTTSTGIPTGYGVVAVDPTVIPLGTRMTIPGYGEGVAADTGPGVKGAAIDVWLPNRAQAAAWGTKIVTITLH